jgi:DNA-binding NarL/FixJ family response regulator
MQGTSDVGEVAGTSTIAVLLAGEQAIVREGLRSLLDAEPGVAVVGDVSNPDEALTMTRDVKPNVVIVDFCGQRLIRTLRSLRQLAPSGEYGRAIAIAARTGRKRMAQARELGASCLLLDETTRGELVDTVRTVAAGGGAKTTGAERSAATAEPFGLTPRELDVIAAVRLGHSNLAIARRLGVVEDTVKHHLRSVFVKTGVKSRLELAVVAMQHRLGEETVAAPTPTNER